MPLRRLAKALGVGPTTIHFHFEGGIGSVFSAVAQQSLAGVTRPFKPKEEPAAYLGELLLKILQALHARPVVAKLVVLQLSSNPLLDPLLAERLLLALAALGAPTEARPRMFRRAMGVIFEMILAECGRSSAEDHKEASARIRKTIASLSPTEFPNLTELREALAAEIVQGGAAKPSPEVATEYADRLIATLSVKWPLGGARTPRSPESARLVAASPSIDRCTIRSCRKRRMAGALRPGVLWVCGPSKIGPNART